MVTKPFLWHSVYSNAFGYFFVFAFSLNYDVLQFLLSAVTRWLAWCPRVGDLVLHRERRYVAQRIVSYWMWAPPSFCSMDKGKHFSRS